MSAAAIIDWNAAYHSEAFKKAKGNRMRYVIPMLGLFTAMFLTLFTLQSYLKDIAQIPVVGYVDLGFCLVMALFPFTGLLGILFVKYTQKYVYPYEEAVVHEFSPVHASWVAPEPAVHVDVQWVLNTDPEETVA